MKEVKALARLETNKACFECGTKGIQNNVAFPINVFVCSVCAGLHRELGHKIKSINMSKFTDAEVAALRDGGNQLAAKQWKPNLKVCGLRAAPIALRRLASHSLAARARAPLASPRLAGV